ncbi:lysophospholipid acyltransferase family protein [Robertmurraya korlensis]|uniref:lysophospholipid acyltransferase family protein n=1 Tax=Robertmurraya korlensis TaxID=519977 RepID=UPI000825DAB2|nr:lysophospholipid acyltransferase family protein [Robertmurraya korlensis]
MIRLIAVFLYMSGYLIYSIPTLKKMKNLDKGLSVSERDQLIHTIPNQWSKIIMKLTGSKVKVEGTENLPEGAVVLISNHEGDFDIPTLLASIEKPFGFISKVEVKKVPILSSWMEIMNCVFLDRSDRRKSVQSIREAVKLLKEGHSIAIFPEGTRSKGGPVGEFKSGGFRLAKDAKVPIVPISISGTSHVFEKNGRLVKPASIHVRILPSIPSSIFDQKDMREVSDYVREIIVNSLKDEKIAS